jgi:hypothetical protein
MAKKRGEYHNLYQKRHKTSFYSNDRIKAIIQKESQKHGSESALINNIVTQFYKGYELEN